jgi:hypothetical protein
MYIDCRYGQLHLATAYPQAAASTRRRRSSSCTPRTAAGADFGRCAALLGTDRSIYAPDLPGSGASDSPKGRMAVAGLALAVVDLIDTCACAASISSAADAAQVSRSSSPPRGRRKCGA